MIERLYMAIASNDEKDSMIGPFVTAEEAEKQARLLGWRWVLVYTQTVENTKVIDVQSRLYEINANNGDEPMSAEAIREKLESRLIGALGDLMGLAPVVPILVPPLTEADKKFFEQYERQMEEQS